MDREYVIKITDLGIGREIYSADYCWLEADQEKSLPIRWMAWESILMVSQLFVRLKPRLIQKSTFRVNSPQNQISGHLL